MPDFNWSALLTADGLVALLTLTALEIVLGIDNVVFIAILTGKLPEERRAGARNLGLALAMITRILLLLAISWIMGLTKPLFDLDILAFEQGVSGRDLILLGGGLFLIAKATYEIHDKLEAGGEHGISQRRAASYASVIVQILLLDLVFSLDSVITAVGMADEIIIMVIAVVIAIGVMLAFAGPISRFVERRPTVKMLALSFLLLIGVMLVAEGFHRHIPKGYIYFAMAFSLFVELLNLRLRKTQKPIQLQPSLNDVQPQE